MMPSSEFWSGRTVLLTGHTGFKGSWASLWLQNVGATVVGYALDPPSTPNLFEQATVADGMEHVHGDVRDLDAFLAVAKKYRPDIVLHMAAQTLVGEGYRSPVYTYATNVMGTVNVLEAVRLVEGIEACVIVTTDKCYQNKEWHWGYREVDRLGGKDPYSSSKACAELVTHAYRQSYFERGVSASPTAVASVRAGNVIGGGDWAEDRLIPDIVRGFLAGDSVLIRNPNAIRPWQHVLEPVCGYLTLAQRLVEEGAGPEGAWNFGPSDDDARPVEWIADQMASRWGEGATWTRDERAHPPEAGYLKLDSSKARAELGWAARFSLADALDWTVDWYRAYERGDDPRAVTEQQIADYQVLGVGRADFTSLTTYTT